MTSSPVPTHSMHVRKSKREPQSVNMQVINCRTHGLRASPTLILCWYLTSLRSEKHSGICVSLYAVYNPSVVKVVLEAQKLL